MYITGRQRCGDHIDCSRDRNWKLGFRGRGCDEAGV